MAEQTMNARRVTAVLRETGDDMVVLAIPETNYLLHLKVLKDAGLLNAREDGRWVYYSLAPQALQELRAWLGTLAARCTTPAAPCC